MLDAIRSLPNGARFYRVDLHNHTPADPSFHCGAFNLNNEDERRALAREYVRFAREEQELDIIGITDHNDASWIAYIQAAAAGTGLIVVPGVELGANEGKRQVHFLALFEPGTDPHQIDHFISSLGLLPNGRFHLGAKPTPRLTQLNTRELTARIVTADDGLPGLAIAAHATRKNGLIHELEGEGRVLAYEDENLIAVEIPTNRAGLSDFVLRLVNGEADHYGNKAVACLNSSDGRGLATVEKGRLPIGARPTRIKLSTVSLDALRHAFIDFDSRIRLEGEHTEEKYPRLVGLGIEGGFLTGQPTAGAQAGTLEPFLLHLNPNLNTVIGGRGTGKSSLLEAIRFVFDLEPRTEATQQQTQNVVEATLPPGAGVTAFYALADGTCYKITRQRGRPPQVYAVKEGAAVDVHPRSLIPGGVPLEVYGQKEVYEIANDVNFQLNLLDTYVADALRAFKREETTLLRNLDTNARQILRLEEEIAEADQQVAELAARKLELERLEKDTSLQQLERKKGLETEKVALDQLAQAVQVRLEEIQALNTSPGLPALPVTTPLINSQAAILTRIDRLIEGTLRELSAQIAAAWEEGAAERSAWQATYAQNEAAYQELLGKHGDNLSIERYFALQAQCQALEQVAARQSLKRTRLAELRQARQEMLAELQHLRQTQEYGLRLAKAEALTAALQGHVRVTLKPQGNRDAYQAHLADLFQRRKITKTVFQKLAQAELDPIALAAAIRAERTAAEEDETTLAQIGITAAYRSRLAALPDELLYQLETYRIPDLPDISLKVEDEYRSLTPPPGVPGLSTGQKCTAILSIILVERHTPLVIDQPEDDLDNAFIFREIVQTLRREKERRQFIIATHNANIPVSGDAELILLMKANARRGWVAHRGSIDDPALREPVETILEGGREAFRLRQAKYDI